MTLNWVFLFPSSPALKFLVVDCGIGILIFCFAEKYELERKALYDSLLRPSSPKESATSDQTDPMDEPAPSYYVENDVDDEQCNDDETMTNEMESEPQELQQEVPEVPSPAEEENLNHPEDDGDVELPEEEEAPVNLSALPARPKRATRKERKPSSESEPEEPPVVERRTLRSSDKPKVFQIEKHKDEILEKILEKPPEVLAPVKLLISKKKGSIFKSRSLIPDESTKKRRAVYKHKWTVDDTPQRDCDASQTPKSDENTTYDDYGFNDNPLTRVTNPGDDDDNPEGITSIKCTKGDKGVRDKLYYHITFFYVFKFLVSE